MVVEGVLSYFLQRAHRQFAEDTFYEAVSAWPPLSDLRRPLLQRASERMAARDWVSAGHIVVTTYEAVLRDLLRAGGYAALKGDPSGILADETLASLLQRPAVRKALGENHVWFVEHVLCRPDLGPNLRNEVAHGTISVTDLTPTRVLLVWLFLIRITCFVPTPAKPQREPSDTSEGSA